MNDNNQLYAAVDLGSNSFHMIVAKIIDDQLHIIDTHKDMVRLANGLDSNGNLSASKIDEAIDSLEKIGQRIQYIRKSHLRVVGTNTLRKAKNASDFVSKAERVLGKPIEIVSGREEARMLYLGVSHFLPSGQGRRLVIDIGGGSTELIIGEEFEPLVRESLYMGCVSYSQKFFADGVISEKNFNQAVLHARRELVPIVPRYLKEGWNHVIGASGTLCAASQIIVANNYAIYGINRDSLKQLVQQCIHLGSIENLQYLNGLSLRRQPVFIGGLAIIQALSESLSLDKIESCDGALREGLIYDLSGRLTHNDIRQRTLDKLVNQFEINASQSNRVKRSIDQLVHLSHLPLNTVQLELLDWAAQLNELGLNISHSYFEMHAAYIINNADMPGFSNQEQLKLAALVAQQRRKIKSEWLDKLSDNQHKKLLPLIVILRLAVILNRPRIDCECGIKKFEFRKNTVTIKFKHGWLASHPLTHADLIAEAEYLTVLNLNYSIQ